MVGGEVRCGRDMECGSSVSVTNTSFPASAGGMVPVSYGIGVTYGALLAPIFIHLHHRSCVHL